jgi:hypothetical protein
LTVAASALSRAPQLCSAAQLSVTNLTTRFIIYDGRRPALDVATRKAWECVGPHPQEPSALLLR